MAKIWNPKTALVAPSSSDTRVLEVAAVLEKELFEDELGPVGSDGEDSLAKAASFLYIATNLTAMDSNAFIMLQNLQFDAIKLCDAWSLMLTSYKIGANDILEKLHLAYLRLLEGFPDTALEDVKSVSKHVDGMIQAAEKAGRAFTGVKQMMKAAGESLCIRAEEDFNHLAAVKSSVEEVLRQRHYAERKSETASRPTENDIVGQFLLELDAQEPKSNFVVARESLLLALGKVEQAERRIQHAEQFARKWYNECVLVIEQAMKDNIAATRNLTTRERQEFWEKLPFVERAFQFLCRWKALHQLSNRRLSNMQLVRSKADCFYIENLLPREAVQKAWKLVRDEEALKHIRFFVMTNAERVRTIGDHRYSFDQLPQLQTPDGINSREVRESTFEKMEYRDALGRVRKLGMYLTVLGYLFPEKLQELEAKRTRFVEMCRMVVDIVDKFEKDSVDLLIRLQIACNCCVRGLHTLVEADLEPKLIAFDHILCLVNEVSWLDPSFTETITNVLEKDRRDMAPDDVDGSSQNMSWYSWVCSFGGKASSAENMKRVDMSLEVVKLAKGCLPLEDVVNSYLAISHLVAHQMGEVVAGKGTGENVDMKSRDWRDDAIKFFQWLQSFRMVCRDDRLTGVDWMRTQRTLQTKKVMKSWDECSAAIKKLGDSELAKLVDEVEVRSCRFSGNGSTWRTQQVGDEALVIKNNMGDMVTTDTLPQTSAQPRDTTNDTDVRITIETAGDNGKEPESNRTVAGTEDRASSTRSNILSRFLGRLVNKPVPDDDARMKMQTA